MKKNYFILFFLILICSSFTTNSPNNSTRKQISVKGGTLFTVVNNSPTAQVNRLSYNGDSYYLYLTQYQSWRSGLLYDSEVILKMHGEFDHIDVVDGNGGILKTVQYDSNFPQWNDYVIDVSGWIGGTNNQIIVY
jgi:hypothetical protein